MTNKIETCPCCSKLPFETCCKPYLDGKALAPDPVTLMRSRYTAFVLKKLEYIFSTWHPETRPTLGEDEPSNWVSLEIVQSEVEDDEGEVEFIAKLIIEHRLETLHEIADFVRVDAKWLYHSGEFQNEDNPSEKISMKTPCPCGSGEKFKHCHYSK